MNLLLYYTHGREYDVPKINEGLFSIVLIFSIPLSHLQIHFLLKSKIILYASN